MKDNIQVTICTGTACFVMGGSELVMLEENLPDHMKEHVTVKGSTCVEYCKDNTYGKAPFVKIDDHIMGQATIPKILKYLEDKLEA